MPAREYRFVGITRDGKTVQGTIVAESLRRARTHAQQLATRHGLRIVDLIPRRTFIYRARTADGRVIAGEQRAYSADELKAALRRLGLEVLRVERKLLDFQFKPSRQDVIMFVRLAANLLRENLSFDEVLNLLEADVSSRSLKLAIRDLGADLRAGMEARQAFMKHQHVFGRFTSYMLGLASQSGNMADIFEATARFLERQNEFKRSLRSSLISPALTFIALVATFIWYVWYIFPMTAGLLADLGMSLPPMTAATLEFSYWIDRNIWLLLTGFGALAALIAAILSTEKGKITAHRVLIKLPIIGSLLHKINVEIFCRVFAIIYTGAGNNTDVIRIAAEACGNRYMEHRIKTISLPLLVAQGAELTRALEASGVFTPMAIARFRTGAATGNVRGAAEQTANYYEKETGLKLKSVIDTIQAIIAIILSIAIAFLTIVSSEIALVQPSMTDLMR